MPHCETADRAFKYLMYSVLAHEIMLWNKMLSLFKVVATIFCDCNKVRNHISSEDVNLIYDTFCFRFHRSPAM
jgi:hypothetical protein